MATVTGLTATRMAEIEGQSVVDGEVVGNDLVLTKHNGQTIVAGNLRGFPGEDGYIKKVLLPAVKLLTSGPSIELSTVLDSPNIPSGAAKSVSWSPDQRILTIGHNNQPYVTNYIFDGIYFTKLDIQDIYRPTGNVKDVSWSLDGRFLSVAHSTSPFITAYEFNGKVFNKITNPLILPSGNANAVAWSPNGRYLAIGTSSSPYLHIYSFDGTTLSKLSDPAYSLPGAVEKVSWYPDGTLFSVACSSSPYLVNYSFDGTTATKLSNPATLPTSSLTDVSWSPDGAYLAAASTGAPGGMIWSYNAGEFTNRTLPNAGPAISGKSVSWSPDRMLLTICFSTASKPYTYFIPDSWPIEIIYGSGADIVRNSSEWSPDGRYVAYATETTPFIKVHNTYAKYYTDGSYAYAFR